MAKTKPFRTKVTLQIQGGGTHIVTLSGPEPAVRKVATLVNLGAEMETAAALIQHKRETELWRPN